MAERLPALPEVGHPEIYYARKGKQAEKRGDHHAHEAYKVGQYVTLALDPNLPWPVKLRYFRHALDRHCHPPPLPEEDVWLFYQRLAHLVREHAGREALRLCLAEDDRYAAMKDMGVSEEEIEEEAENFFRQFITQDECPYWFLEEDWRQLKMIRDQWI
jgi:uncharacterized protein YjiS (DUF1127 family)